MENITKCSGYSRMQENERKVFTLFRGKDMLIHQRLYMLTLCFGTLNNRSLDRALRILVIGMGHLFCLPQSATARYVEAAGGIRLCAAADSRNKGIKSFHSVDTAMNERGISGTPLS